MSDRQNRNQVIPDEFRDVLMKLRQDKDPRLPLTLSVARMNGWTLQSLGVAIGVSREWIRLLVANCDPNPRGRIPEVPLPPRLIATPQPPRRRRLRVKPEVAEQLRAMHAIAKTVNGATPSDAQERRVSEELSALLNSLVEQGVTAYHLAQVLETTPSAVTSRLARHGYRESSPSLSGNAYIGRAAHEGEKGEPRESCNRGHQLSGSNLYVVPKTGARVCRECDSRRRSTYFERKQQRDSEPASA